MKQRNEKDMLTGISWSDYFTALAVALGIYYVIIALRYYPQDIKRWVSGKRTGTKEEVEPPKEEEPDSKSGGEQGSFHDEEATERAFEAAEKLTGEIRITIRESAEKGISRQDLILLISTLIADYPQFNGTAFQMAINNVINIEMEKYGSVPLSAVELDGLWEEGS